MSPDDLESLEETLDILRDDDLMKSLRQSRKEAASDERLQLKDNTQDHRVHEVEITPEGLRHLTGYPRRCGKQLSQRFSDLSRRTLEVQAGPFLENSKDCTQPDGGDYRIIYEIFEDDQVILIHRVQHRRGVYRPR